MILLYQSIPIFSSVLDYGCRIPLATSADSLIRTLQSHLSWKLVDRRILRIGMLNGIHDCLTDKQRTVFRMLRPPVNQCFVIGCLVSYLPINLRNVIINPSFTCPKQYVGIKIIIVLQTICVAAQRICFLIAVNTERADSELHPRLDAPYCFMKFLDQDIHVATTPVRLITETASVTGKARIVREIDSLDRIRIEIIVHVDSIYIVTGYNIGNNLADMLTAFGKCRIKIDLITISDKPFRMFMINMCRCQLILQ